MRGVKGYSGQLYGHTRVDNFARSNRNLQRQYGEGPAMCSCGVGSLGLSSERARMEWHFWHKGQIFMSMARTKRERKEW